MSYEALALAARPMSRSIFRPPVPIGSEVLVAIRHVGVPSCDGRNGRGVRLVCTAIARELVGFMWSIGREARPA